MQICLDIRKNLKKKMHFGALARLKILILLLLIIIVRCWQAYVRSFDGEILGSPFLIIRQPRHNS